MSSVLKESLRGRRAPPWAGWGNVEVMLIVRWWLWFEGCCLFDVESFEEEKPGRIDRRLCSDSSGVGLQMHEGGVEKVSLKGL
jgi:hypothetical protein